MAELQIESRIVDAEAARELLEASRYAKQRNIRVKHVQRLAREAMGSEIARISRHRTIPPPSHSLVQPQ
jgi:hypothetical protein